MIRFEIDDQGRKRLAKKARRKCCGQKLTWKTHTPPLELLVCGECGKCYDERASAVEE